MNDKRNLDEFFDTIIESMNLRLNYAQRLMFKNQLKTSWLESHTEEEVEAMDTKLDLSSAYGVMMNVEKEPVLTGERISLEDCKGFEPGMIHGIIRNSLNHNDTKTRFGRGLVGRPTEVDVIADEPFMTGMGLISKGTFYDENLPNFLNCLNVKPRYLLTSKDDSADVPLQLYNVLAPFYPRTLYPSTFSINHVLNNEEFLIMKNSKSFKRYQGINYGYSIGIGLTCTGCQKIVGRYVPVMVFISQRYNLFQKIPQLEVNFEKKYTYWIAIYEKDKESGRYDLVDFIDKNAIEEYVKPNFALAKPMLHWGRNSVYVPKKLSAGNYMNCASIGYGIDALFDIKTEEPKTKEYYLRKDVKIFLKSNIDIHEHLLSVRYTKESFDSYWYAPIYYSGLGILSVKMERDYLSKKDNYYSNIHTKEGCTINYYDHIVGNINYYEFEFNSMEGDLINFVYGVRKQQRERLYNDTSKNKKNKYEKRYF